MFMQIVWVTHRCISFRSGCNRSKMGLAHSFDFREVFVMGLDMWSWSSSFPSSTTWSSFSSSKPPTNGESDGGKTCQALNISHTKRANVGCAKGNQQCKENQYSGHYVGVMSSIHRKNAARYGRALITQAFRFFSSFVHNHVMCGNAGYRTAIEPSLRIFHFSKDKILPKTFLQIKIFSSISLTEMNISPLKCYLFRCAGISAIVDINSWIK